MMSMKINFAKNHSAGELSPKVLENCLQILSGNCLEKPCWRGKRQFTDKTVRRHNFSRQFPDRIGDNSPTILETVHRHFCNSL